MTKRRTLSALIAATLSLGATAAYADQPAAAASSQDLQKQLEALQQQVRELRAREAERAACGHGSSCGCRRSSAPTALPRRSCFRHTRPAAYSRAAPPRVSARACRASEVVDKTLIRF